MESVALTVEAADLKRRMDGIEQELLSGEDVPSLARVLRGLDSRYQDVQHRLMLARQKESNPVGETLAEAQSLFDVVSSGDEAARLRLRTLLSQR